MSERTKAALTFLILLTLAASAVLMVGLTEAQSEPNLCFEDSWARWMPIDSVAFRDLKHGCDSGDGDWNKVSWRKGWCWHPANDASCNDAGKPAQMSAQNMTVDSMPSSAPAAPVEQKYEQSPPGWYPLYIGWETRYNYYRRRHGADWRERCLSVESPPPPSLVAHCG